jgi:hypothetical protein
MYLAVSTMRTIGPAATWANARLHDEREAPRVVAAAVLTALFVLLVVGPVLTSLARGEGARASRPPLALFRPLTPACASRPARQSDGARSTFDDRKGPQVDGLEDR